MTPNTPDPDRHGATDADRLMVELLAHSESEREAALTRICDERPDIGPALRGLYEHWRALEGVLSALRAHSLEDDLQRRYGSRADPHVSLDPEPAGTCTATADGLVERVARLIEREGRYKVLDQVAVGGMGTILRVWDRDLRRTLAMKVAATGADPESRGSKPASDSTTIAYFLQEAQIMAQLGHPGVAPVHELGLDSSGRIFFTMQLVGGRELREIIRSVHRGDGGWTLTRAVGVILKVCETMAFAHRKHVVHRDLKPSNIMVGEFGEVFVMDWGLARVLDDRSDPPGPPPELGSAVRTDRQDVAGDATDCEHTLEGDVIGTPTFMAPEQAAGRLDEISPQTDVYSVGATLYTLLAGHMPYVEPGGRVRARQVVASVLAGPPKPVRKVAPGAPRELLAICEKAMARDRAQRYANMEELAADLRSYLEGRVVIAHASGPVAVVRKWMRRNRALVAVMIVAAIAITAACVVSGWWYLRAESARQERAVVTRLCGQVQQDVANAHLWFEEAVAEDRSVDLDRDVYGLIDTAIRAADTVLSGGVTPFGTLRPIDEADGGAAARELRDRLSLFRRTTEERWTRRRAEGRTGAPLDQRYDAIYRDVLAACTAVSLDVNRAVDRDWRVSAGTSVTINLLVLACFGAIAVLVGRQLTRSEDGEPKTRSLRRHSLSAERQP